MMKPISAEDKIVDSMKRHTKQKPKHKSAALGKEARLLGIIIILFALLLDLFNSLSLTSLSILDTDPTTYIIVVLLMLFVFPFFYLKDKELKIETKTRNIFYGIALFAAYLIIVAYMRAAFSFLFISYRLDLLALPLYLSALIVMLFGSDGIKRMKLLIIYSVFASPLLLLPLLNLSNVFAIANADIIYGILHSSGIPVVSSGILISASGYSISIASTCTDIGAFVALAMFLIPIAYLFNGKIKRKVLWIISGIALMSLLNILRMASIALEWAYYGISNAIALFHLFIGPILFYITIIVMILISYKFRLSMPQINTKGIKIKTYAPYSLALCVVFGIIGFFFTLPYQSLMPAPIINFNNQQIANQSGIMIDRYILLTLESAKMNITQIAGNTSDLIFALSKKNLTSPIYVLVNYSAKPNIEHLKLRNSSVEMSTSLLKNGIAVSGGTVTSYNSTYNNTPFFAFDYFTIPYNMSGREFSLRYFFFKKINENQSVSNCQNYTSVNSVGPVNYIDSFIYDAINYESLNSPNGICAAYAVANNATG